VDRYYDIDDDVRIHESVEKLQEVCEGLTLPGYGPDPQPKTFEHFSIYSQHKRPTSL
jgi:hypothetical protein